MVMTRIVYDVKYQAGLAREAGSRVPASYADIIVYTSFRLAVSFSTRCFEFCRDPESGVRRP